MTNFTLETLMGDPSQYTILHRLRDSTLIVDKNYCIVFVNQHYLDSCGMTEEAVLGQKCHEIISEKDTLEIGIKRFITKPVTTPELATLIRQVLDDQPR